MRAPTASRVTRRIRGAAIVAACLLGLLVGIHSAPPASAHAQLVSSTPADGATLDAAPTSIELEFNESVHTVDDAYRLVTSGGDVESLSARAVDATVTVELPGELGDDDYLVAYRVVSADGHPVAGTLEFVVGDGGAGTAELPGGDVVATSAPVAVAHAAVNALHYLGLLVFAGLAFFSVMIARESGRLAAGVRRTLIASGLVAAVASLALIVTSALDVAGRSLGDLADPGRWWSGIQTPPIVAAVIVCVAVAASLTLLLVARRAALRSLGVVVAACAVLAPMLVGHSAAFDPLPLSLTADGVHLLVAAGWAGGIVGLLLAVWPTASRGADAAELPRAETAVSRFSAFALWSIVVLAVSGAGMALLFFDSVRALIDTNYGLSLLAKLAVVALIVVAGAANRQVILPRIRTQPSDTIRWRMLRRSLLVEAALLVAVLAVTGWLTTQSPTGGADTAGETASAGETADQLVHIEQGELTVHGMFEPRDGNRYEMSFMISGPDGAVVTDDPPQVEFTLPDQNLGPIVADMTFEKQTSRYFATAPLPVAGDWQASIAVHLSKYEEPVITTEVDVR